MVELFSEIDYNKFYDEIWEEIKDLEDEILDKNLQEKEEDYKKSFWGIKLEYNATYNLDENKYGKKLTKWKWVTHMKNGTIAKYSEKKWRYEEKKPESWHKETYYSQKQLPGKDLNIPWRHVAKDGTIRDQDGYICVACNYLPKKSLIMTTLWPGKVYDKWWMKGNWIDLYVNW